MILNYFVNAIKYKKLLINLEIFTVEFLTSLKGTMQNYILNKCCWINSWFYWKSTSLIFFFSVAPLKRTSSWSFDEKLVVQSLYKVFLISDCP